MEIITRSMPRKVATLQLSFFDFTMYLFAFSEFLRVSASALESYHRLQRLRLSSGLGRSSLSMGTGAVEQQGVSGAQIQVEESQVLNLTSTSEAAIEAFATLENFERNWRTVTKVSLDALDVQSIENIFSAGKGAEGNVRNDRFRDVVDHR